MSWRDKYKVHPAADVFPMMGDDELKALGEDIKANGLKQPIVVQELRDGKNFTRTNTLLDGRNRLEAMERLGWVWELDLEDEHSGDWDFIPAPQLEKYRGRYRDGCDQRIDYRECNDEDVVAYVISANIHRRHLTKAQQADLIVAAIKAGEKPRNDCEVSKGGRGKVNETKAKAVAEAEKLGISKRTVEASIAKANGKTPKKKNTAEQEAREKRVKQHMEERQAKADKRQLEKNDHQVKDFLVAVKAFESALGVAAKSVSKFAPEATSFAAQRLDRLVAAIGALRAVGAPLPEPEPAAEFGVSPMELGRMTEIVLRESDPVEMAVRLVQMMDKGQLTRFRDEYTKLAGSKAA